MKKISMLLLAFIFATNMSIARTEKQMLAIAHQKLAQMGSTRSTGIETKLVKKMGALNIYGADNGFVVVSKSDACSPILGYSATPFDENNLPCGFAWWLETTNKNLERGNVKTETTLLTSDNATGTQFITTKWNQGKPYNNLCPEIDGEKCQTGCVATAMAQVIKYYQYPTSGTGKGYYYVGNSTTPTEVEINGVYDYENMRDRYLLSYKEKQAKAVATLMADAGASCAMQYSLEGSGAQMVNAAVGFANNFQYDSLEIKDRYRMFYDDNEWTDLVYKEMQASRPIIYAGATTDNAGHAFVFCGLKTEEDGTKLVYVNWGWGGNSDGYFSIDNLESNGGTYSEYQEMIYGFNPQPTSSDSKYTSFFAHEDTPTFAINGNTLTSNGGGGLYNYDFRYFTGNILLSIYSCDETTTDSVDVVVIDDKDANNVAYGYGWQFDDAEEICKLDELGLHAGKYKVFFSTKAENEDVPQPIRSIGGVKYATLTMASDGSLSIENSSSGISNIIADRATKANGSKVYDLNGNRVSNSFKGLKIVKGRKYVEK